MNLKCAIVDDEPLALGLLESYVNKTPFLELVGKYSSAVQAIKELPEKHIDLLFLDIQMPELNGLEFSKMVDSGTRIVFTTAFDQYAIDGYKVNALDYLLKPISYVDFLQAANKAVQWFELPNRYSFQCHPLRRHWQFRLQKKVPHPAPSHRPSHRHALHTHPSSRLSSMP